MLTMCPESQLSFVKRLEVRAFPSANLKAANCDDVDDDDDDDDDIAFT